VKNILVVDDDEMIRDLFILLLEIEGYHVEMAVNGDEALKKVAKSSWDLMVLDLSMPVMDGITLLQELKNSQIQSPKIIVLSGLADDQKRQSLKDLGAADVLQKPVDLTVFVERIKALI